MDLAPVLHQAGPLNRLPRDMGEQPPFRQTVKDVCASCNSGWLADLEGIAQRVLTPLIQGTIAPIATGDQAAIAMWVQKTALVAMLLSSEDQRSHGYGLARCEYKSLYERRDPVSPLGASQAWVGRYDAPATSAAVQVTPLCVRVAGLPEPDLPQAYVMTVVVGALVLQALHFIDTSEVVKVSLGPGVPRIWPPGEGAALPFGFACDQGSFRQFAAGGSLESSVDHVSLEPWSHATQLPQSAIKSGRVEVPAVCGQHAIYYPTKLLSDAYLGLFYAFIVACDCNAYLIHTTARSARFKAAGTWEGISAMYEDPTGQEVVIEDQFGTFFYKRLPSQEL